MDRLTLLALFDRNKSKFSIIFDIFLATLVSILATAILKRSVYVEFATVLFAFVVASAHFSLLKRYLIFAICNLQSID